jgi:hypothetical protein
MTRRISRVEARNWPPMGYSGGSTLQMWTVGEKGT